MQSLVQRCAWLLCLVLGLAPLWNAHGQAPTGFVYHTTLSGEIDLGLAPHVQRVLRQAEQDGAAAVVLEINTFGGRLDAAVQLRDALLESRVFTLAFVNKRAISAGALIALAARSIAMADGGTIGAATPVRSGGTGAGMLPTEEKTVSYVRKEFRATAERRGRPLAIAEAMVDSDVAIPGVVDQGKLLTLTTRQAVAQQVADFRADTLPQALAQAGMAGVEIRRVPVNWAENLVRWLTHPVVSSLLVSLAMVGILLELRTPGFGVPGAIGVSSLVLVLWGHWLVALAGWEELLLVGAGAVLLLVELLVIPGFGVAGVLGIAAVLAGLVLSLVGAGNTPQLLAAVGLRVGFALVFAVALSLVALRFLGGSPAGRRLVLKTRLEAAEGFASAPQSDAALLGKHGQARSMLRPAGIAEIDGVRVDVVTEGDLVNAGDAVVVVRVDGNRVVVQRATTAPKGNG